MPLEGERLAVLSLGIEVDVFLPIAGQPPIEIRGAARPVKLKRLFDFSYTPTLAKRVELDSFEGMIRLGFLLGDGRSALIALARDGSVTHRLARRANAPVLLDDGLSCEQVARVLLLDDDTIRRWHGAFAEGGRKALMRFEAGGSACVLSEAQWGKLVAWVRAASPRATGQI